MSGTTRRVGRAAVVACVLACVLGTAGCGKALEAGVDALLLITNSWAVEGQPGRSFNFVSQDDGGSSGTFTGEEEVDGQVNPLTGSWASGRITFTVGGSNGSTYTGSFTTDNPTTLDVASQSESIRLVRGG